MLTQSIKAHHDIAFVTQHRRLFLFMLMLMSAAGLVGSDVYLPMLPELGKQLLRDPHEMQFTLGIYLLGLSLGQLMLGPLTDRFGRRKLLIGGMVIYFLASLGCAAAINYPMLLTFRFIQAMGACSGLIIGRAIVGDVYDAQQSAKRFLLFSLLLVCRQPFHRLSVVLLVIILIGQPLLSLLAYLH